MLHLVFLLALSYRPRPHSWEMVSYLCPATGNWLLKQWISISINPILQTSAFQLQGIGRHLFLLWMYNLASLMVTSHPLLPPAPTFSSQVSIIGNWKELKWQIRQGALVLLITGISKMPVWLAHILRFAETAKIRRNFSAGRLAKAVRCVCFLMFFPFLFFFFSPS